jgi:UTP--glucose-1-phosphate uridylyltransferase
MSAVRPSPALLKDMRAKGIDVSLTLSILEDWNAGLYDGAESFRAAGVPAVDGRRVISLAGGSRLAFPVNEEEARARLSELGLALPPSTSARPSSLGGQAGRELVFERPALEEIGSALLARTAYGVLNGGSATSYADSKKNQAFGAEVFAALESAYDSLAPLCRDRPKGLCPAYINPDGSPGASFLALKMRARLIAASRLAAKGRRGGTRAEGGAGSSAAVGLGHSFMPLYQMTSIGNDDELRAAYEALTEDPLIQPLASRLGIAGMEWATGVQPMIAAYTHSSEGRPKRVFDRAWGRPDCSLPLPGGHGQCFRVLAPVFRALRDSGIRFAYIGNVDNLGYVPDPLELALLALSGKPAAFDFALRTPVDVKGGVLVETADGRRTIADIGPAISFDEVRRLEEAGSSILFNCATGLFDLDWLVPRLGEIARRLPVRVTDQDKDAGRYSQAEQVTWEVASILPDFLAFAVDKYERFIAAKLLVETLLTSGVATSDPRLPPELSATSARLKAGLEALLSGIYGLRLEAGRWVPEDDIGRDRRK